MKQNPDEAIMFIQMITSKSQSIFNKKKFMASCETQLAAAVYSQKQTFYSVGLKRKSIFRMPLSATNNITSKQHSLVVLIANLHAGIKKYIKVKIVNKNCERLPSNLNLF